ncbi:4174_t:CDS:2 [Rhizophagus irregularis]|nr:4174_t:CDS:2 [Rhizophagus irregularis]
MYNTSHRSPKLSTNGPISTMASDMRIFEKYRNYSDFHVFPTMNFQV